jgi:hypothetical protein
VDISTVTALVAAAISLIAAGFTGWQAITARRQARAAELQNLLLRQQLLDDRAAHMQMIRAADEAALKRLAVVSERHKGHFTLAALNPLKEAVREAYASVVDPETKSQLGALLMQVDLARDLRHAY